MDKVKTRKRSSLSSKQIDALQAAYNGIYKAERILGRRASHVKKDEELCQLMRIVGCLNLAKSALKDYVLERGIKERVAGNGA